MAQHGYLREYDEGPGRRDDNDRDRGREGGWRDDDRERGWRSSGSGPADWRNDDREFSERNRNFMLGDRNRSFERAGDGDQDRGFFGRMGDDARSWFRDDDRQFRGGHPPDRDQPDYGSSGGYGREHGYGGFQGDYSRSGQSQGGFGGRGDWERSPRNFSSHQDDHYRSWRDRQMGALDRDYQDYCREREQQFHQDFDSWRRNRQSQGQAPGGQQQSGGSSPEVMELNNPTDLSTEPQSGPSATGDATLGTNNSENSGVGRGRR
jgi:hypothetical protein